jgi:CheY-like chemotaxis protein/Flp pilus assembly protein TadD
MPPPKSILLVEPDERERQELTSVLAKLGYAVDSAPNSREGLRAFAEGRHDLVVVEVLLPGMNGLQFCKIVKEQGAEWGGKVIVVSKIYQSRAMEYDAVNRYKADAYFARPFPLVKLVERIGELIGGPNIEDRIRAKAAHTLIKDGPPPVAPPKASERRPEKPAPAAPEPPLVHFIDPPPPPSAGEFTPMLLARLLGKLGREEYSGLLELSHDRETKHVYFVAGKPVFVKSTIPDESLGAMLLADGAISQEQYDRAMAEMAASGKKFGTVIARLGVMSSEDLYYHLVKQTRLKIARCFAWESGRYAVNSEARYAPDATMFESDSCAVVLDGCRHHLDAAPLEADYERCKDHYLFPGEAAAAAAARVYLSPDERALLSVANGRLTLGEAAAESPLGLMPALRVVSALLAIGALRLAQVEKRPELSAYESEPPPSIDPPESDPSGAERYNQLKALFVRMDDLNHFELLGVPREVDDEALRKAFLALEQKFHPDVFTIAAPERVYRMAVTVCRRLRQAYETLRDPATRLTYASGLAAAGAGAASLEASAPGSPEEEGSSERRAKLHFQNGVLALEQRRYGLAVESFQKALSARPKDAECRARLAMAMFKYLDEPTWSWDDVEGAVRQALALTPDHVELLALMGQVKAKQGDDEKALRYLRRAVELDPGNAELKRDIRYAEQRQSKKSDKDDRKKSLFGKRR